MNIFLLSMNEWIKSLLELSFHSLFTEAVQIQIFIVNIFYLINFNGSYFKNEIMQTSQCFIQWVTFKIFFG